MQFPPPKNLLKILSLFIIFSSAGALLLNASVVGQKISTYFLFQQQETAKDAQQDEHMKNTDTTIENLEKDRLERRAETVAYRLATDALLTDIKERISHDEGYAGGALALLGVLQIMGMLKKFGSSAPDVAALVRETVRETLENDRKRQK